MIDLVNLAKQVTITEFSHTLEPLWASDTGRNSNSGKYTGTFIGYFSQVKISFGKLNINQMKYVRSLFDNPTIMLKYPDSATGTDTTEEFYGTAIKSDTNRLGGLYETFDITLTAINRR